MLIRNLENESCRGPSATCLQNCVLTKSGVLHIMDLAGIHDLKNTGFLFIWPSDLVMLTPPSSEGVVRRPGYRWKAVDLLCTTKGLFFVVFTWEKSCGKECTSNDNF